ncbi:phosphatidylinositol 3,4,5-trisphosphate 3-phosphatase and dual-specificity protein phosphatase PTEN isoform X2 [Chironomus tepperi]|uniref:phosphatidylinositol 3,4,5-trisphosphate 3-phosphatase and dual-specificity protein phosphatase PTEN isoform X2 n=1 Tax=Chironomus tepperi TaxID=113505 RepID=UPI00391F11AF
MVSSNTLTNIKMTNAIKGIVSKRKKRYKQDGFNLDLTYICDNIIAMGYPAKNLEGVYRNHIDDVVNFLTTKHNNNYKIYNLCEEKKYQYDITKFQQCASFPFSDHNPPNIELIQSFCNDVHKWLSEDLKNVAAIHCKAGKGRTGTMICCYLLHSGQFKTAAEALNFYGQKRTTDKKGVTIPSQRRYVEYYSQLLKSNKPYIKVAMNICEIKLYNLPPIRTFGTLTFSITMAGSKVYNEQMTELKRVDNYVSIKLDRCLLLVGDVKIEFSSTQILKHKQKLFHFWFNTYFINEINNVDSDGNVIFELNKPEIDDAHKDKQKMFNENFKIETIFQKIPHGGNHINRMQINHTTNGVHNNNLNSRYNNLINNNNDVNQYSSTVLDSHNSDNHNHRVSTRNPSSSQRNNQISTNEFRHSRGDNYQTTSEGSSSPESSSESSGEDWESANKTEDDDEPTACNRSILPSNNIDDDDFSNNLSHSLRRSSYTFDDDHDSEMTDGVSDSENNDDMNNLQSTTSSNFARSFFNNTRRRMSSGIVLSYNFLKGASSKRRDST